MAIQELRPKEAVRGKERIQQLMEEFPEIPRSIIVKADVLGEGVRPSPGSRLAGRWSLPDAHWYFEYDRQDAHTAEETREGYTLTPVAAYHADGLSWHVMYDSRSPYEFRYEERGRYRLYRDGDPIEEVFFVPRPQWYDKKTSSGKPMSSIIAQRGEAGALFLVPLTYCEYAKDNRLCRYCNINASESVKRDLGMERLVGKRDQDIYETYIAAAQESKMPSVGMSGGVMLDSSKEADNYARVAKVLRRAMKDLGGPEANLGVVCQAMGAEDQMKLKEAGFSSATFDLEVWDPRLFEIICPGKAKYVGRERWIERIQISNETFGHATTVFVLGIEMAQPYGFKTEDEAAESVLGGYEWLLSRGITSNGLFWRPVPGTEFADLPSPRTEYFLRTSLAYYKMLFKYNMAPKPGSPPLPPLQHTDPLDFAHLGVRFDSAGSPSGAGLKQDVC